MIRLVATSSGVKILTADEGPYNAEALAAAVAFALTQPLTLGEEPSRRAESYPVSPAVSLPVGELPPGEDA